MFDWIKKRLRRYKIGLVPLFLTLSVSGCSQIEVRKPAAALQETPFPAAGGLQTNAEIVRYVRDLKTALRACNDDKAALAEWAATLE